MNKTQLLGTLKRLSTFVGAPYDEQPIASELHELLGVLGLHFQADAFGNTLVRVRRGLPRNKVAFVAQLDHPALRIAEVKGSQLVLVPEGDVAAPKKGAAITLSESGRTAKIATVSLDKKTSRVKEVVAQLQGKGDAPRTGTVAQLSIEPFANKAQRLAMRAGLVTAGIVTTIKALATLAEQDHACEAWGIFLRAESVGSQGAVALMVSGQLPRDLLLIGLTGKHAKSTELGKGVHVRVGDGMGPYDPRATALVLGALKQESGNGQHELQGEYIAETPSLVRSFVTFGYKATSVALPVLSLGNRGARGVAPEEVDVRDIEAASQLLVKTAERAGSGIDDLDLVRNELVRGAEEGQKRLRTQHFGGSVFAPELG